MASPKIIGYSTILSYCIVLPKLTTQNQRINRVEQIFLPSFIKILCLFDHKLIINKEIGMYLLRQYKLKEELIGRK